MGGGGRNKKQKTKNKKVEKYLLQFYIYFSKQQSAHMKNENQVAV